MCETTDMDVILTKWQ